MTTSSKNSSESQSLTERMNKLQDGEHLLHIRDALRKRNASVMVGAGFSLNAKGGDKNLLTWAKLIDSLLVDLYGDDVEAIKAAKERGNMLRVAEEYAEIRGRAQLEKRLHMLLPDAGVVMPGELHKQLLALSWTDVFTTNYDTLLERTLDQDRSELTATIKRRYQIVVSPKDIPFSRQDGQPRIVKLHGTLRGGTKLIFTEEDYRQYPKDFAPFVNTVQQSMLENVFCLIGFSGDDPNFLSWTGWARDHLGDKAPNLFLITLSPIPNGQRLVLQRRRIFPIDISELGRTKGQDGVDYSKALAAVLEFWKESLPRERVDWPYQSAADDLNGKSELEQLADWLATAQRNREDYPGWLIAPGKNRRRLARESWIHHVLRKLDINRQKVPAWFIWTVIDEVQWILDTSLQRGDETITRRIVELTNYASDAMNNATAPVMPGDVAEPSERLLKEIKNNIALRALRNAREASKADEFNSSIARFEALPADSLTLEQKCALSVEKTVFYMESLNKEKAIEEARRLNSLLGQNVDPYWSVKAGALIAELGMVRKGFYTAQAGLQRIKLAIQNEGERVFLKSRQLWGEFILSALHYADLDKSARAETVDSLNWSPEPVLRELIAVEDKGNSQSNTTELKSDKSSRDSIEHPGFLLSELHAEVDVANDTLKRSTVGIDDNVVSRGNGRVEVRQEGVEAARQYLRLAEHVGISTHYTNVQFLSEELLSCFRLLAIMDDANEYFRVFKRASLGSGYKLAESLHLPIVEELSRENAMSLYQKMMDALSSVSVESKWSDADGVSLGMHLDVASRVAFRLDAPQAVALCDLAIRLHDSPALLKDFNLYEPYRSVFSRVIRLLTVSQLSKYEPTLLSLSITGKVDSHKVRFWPNLVQIARRHNRPTNTSIWHEAVEKGLNELAKADSSNPNLRSYRISKLDWFYHCRCMNSQQEKRFADLLWSELSPAGIPKVENFMAGAFVAWPSPRSPQEDKKLLRRLLESTKFEKIEHEEEILGEKRTLRSTPKDDYLYTLLLSVQSLSHVKLDAREAVIAFQKVRDWWEEEGRDYVQRAIDNTKHRDPVIGRLTLIAQTVNQVLAPKLSLKSVQDEGLDAFFEEIWTAGMQIDAPLVALLFACLRWWPEKTATVIEMAIVAIETNSNKRVVFHSMVGAFRWLKSTSVANDHTRRYIQFLSDGLLHGDEYNLEQKLNTVSELCKPKAELFRPHGQSFLNSLSSLIEILHDPKAAIKARFNLFATPLLRFAAVKAFVTLAAALPELKNDPRYLRSMEIAKSDPLLNIRNLVH